MLTYEGYKIPDCKHCGRTPTVRSRPILLSVPSGRDNTGVQIYCECGMQTPPFSLIENCLNAWLGDKDHKFLTPVEGEEMVRRAVGEAMSNVRRFDQRPFKVFGLNGSKEYASEVANALGVNLAKHEEKQFDDGETYVKSADGDEGNVRGYNVFVIQSLYSDATESVADKFVKLAIMCGSLRDASAHEIIAVIPHLAWARQDRKTESRAPITTKYIAQMLQSVGIHRALFIDVHNLSAEQNAFSVPIDNLEAKNLHAKWCANHLRTSRKIRVMSPDAGGMGRAVRFRNALAKELAVEHEENIEVVHFDKVRQAGKVIGGRIVGDIEDADVLAYDDMISTAGTMQKGCKAVVEGRGRLAAIVASHGLFCGNANSILEQIDAPIVVADTVTPWRLNETNRKKVQLVKTTQMVAGAILRIHSGTGSISELLRS